MFAKLHLLSQDTPEGGAGLRWRAHPYLRMAGAVPKGPAVFDWSARQRDDLEALWRDPAANGARERLAKDLAAFAEKLGWAPEAEMLEDAEQHGEEYLVTLSAVPPELYVLPWEVIQVGASGTYLSDYASAQVRYAVPGLEPREIQTAPPRPGVLFAWSGAGGAVPHEEQAAAIREAAEAGGVAFHELAEVDDRSLQAALDAGPPSVLHLLCHGLGGPEGEPPRLRWGASDSPSEIPATQLARMLRRHHGTIRLVVLSACGSGDGHPDPLFMSSIAQELHKKGIPSVVASRYPLSVPGSRVMTRALYDKMLREAWSLERALRHTREALFRVDDAGETHPGDGYGIQLYAYDTERFVSDNDVEAERPVLASYPFGTAARPVPASPPPAAELTLGMAADSSLPEDELVARLRRVSEDESLTVAIPLRAGGRECSLIVRTTVDGAQRLLGAWRSKVLRLVIGVTVGELILSKAVLPALKGMFSSAAGKAGVAGSKAAARVKSATAAGKVGSAAGQAGATAGQAGATAGQAGGALGQAGGALGQAGGALGQAGAATVGKTAMAAAAITGKAITAKLAVVAVISSVAAAGGVAVYRMESQPAAPVQVAFAGDTRGIESDAPPRIAPASPPATPAPPPTAPEPQRRALAPLPEPVQAPPRKAPEPPPTINAASPPTASASSPPTASASSPPTASASSPATSAAPPTASAAPPTASAAPPTASASPPTASPQTTSPPTAPPPTASAAPPPTASAAPPPTATAASPSTTTVEPALHFTSAPPPGGRTGSIRSGASSNSDPTATGGTNSVCGNGKVEAGEQCDDGNTREGDGCSSTCMKESVARSDVTVDPSALQARQISGNTNVPASKQTRASMIRDHVNNLHGVVKLCVDATGLVTDSTLIERTGYTEYDSKLLETIHEWQFRPYLVNGTPTTVCSTVEFIYSPQ